MTKKVLIIILLIFLVQIISLCNNCFALGDVTENVIWDQWIPEVDNNSGLSEKVGVILGVISVVGIIVSIATLSIIGIKTILGSAEEKAQYKQVLMPWTIGAIMVFSVTTIPTVIYNATNSMLGIEVQSSYKVDLTTVDDTIISEFEKFKNEYVHKVAHGSAIRTIYEIEEFAEHIKQEREGVQKLYNIDYSNRNYSGKLAAYDIINNAIEYYTNNGGTFTDYVDGYKEAISDINKGLTTQGNIEDKITICENNHYYAKSYCMDYMGGSALKWGGKARRLKLQKIQWEEEK